MGRIRSPYSRCQHAAYGLLVALFAFSVQAQESPAPSPSSDEVLIDRVAAVVDGRPILYSDVTAKVKFGPLVSVSEYPATEKSEEYERALNDSVNFELILQKAKELELEIRDDELDTEINHFLQQRDASKSQLMEYLREQGKSFEDYRADFRNQMMIRRFQGRVIGPLVKVTDRDLESYYLKKTGTSAESVELTLRQIMISVPGDANTQIADAKRKLAQEVYEKLTGGMDFQEAAKVFSDDPKARENAGLAQGVKLKDMNPAMRAEVEGLQVGGYTKPIQTHGAVYLLKLEDRKFTGSTEFQAQKNQLEQELKMVELQNQTRKWLVDQRQRSKVNFLGN